MDLTPEEMELVNTLSEEFAATGLPMEEFSYWLEEHHSEIVVRLESILFRPIIDTDLEEGKHSKDWYDLSTLTLSDQVTENEHPTSWRDAERENHGR